MLNRIFVVDSVTLSSTGTAVSSYVPFDQTTRKLPTQVVVKATGQGAYVRLSNDASAATNVDVLVQGGDHVVLSVQGRRWVSVLSDGASSTVSVGALSTGVSGDAASLSLDFAGTGTLDPRVTFTRASTGTYFNSAGVLTSAATNAPRFDYNPSTLAAQGLLIEESRANRFSNSSAGAGATIGTGTSIAPDGNLMAKAVCPSGVAAFPQIGNGTGNTQSFTLTAGQTIDVAFSGYFAAGTSGMVIEPMLVADARTAPSSNFTYATLQINTSNWTVRSKALGVDWSEVQAPSITLFRAGVYRVTWVVRYTQGATIRDATGVYCQLRDTAGSGTFTGDGIGHFQYFGIQGETGSFPTSTILTTTAAATRAADVASVNTLAPWYNAAEGTVYTESVITSTAPTSGFPTIAGFTDGTINNRIIAAYLTQSTDTLDYFVAAGGSPQASLTGPVYSANSVVKTGSAYKTNDFAYCVNNGSVGVDTSGTIPTVSTFHLGNQISGNVLNGYLRRITYYPRRLSNAELQAITA